MAEIRAVNKSRLDISGSLLGLLETSETKKKRAIKKLTEALTENYRKVSRLGGLINKYSVNSLGSQMDEVVQCIGSAVDIEKALYKINPDDSSLIIINRLIGSLTKEYSIISRQMSYVLNEYKDINDQIDNLSTRVQKNKPKVVSPKAINIDKKLRSITSSRPPAVSSPRRSNKQSSNINNLGGLPPAAAKVFRGSIPNSVKASNDSKRGFDIGYKSSGTIIITPAIAPQAQQYKQTNNSVNGSNNPVSNAAILAEKKKKETFWSKFENTVHEDLDSIRKLLKNKLGNEASGGGGGGQGVIGKVIESILELAILKKLNPLNIIKGTMLENIVGASRKATKVTVGAGKLAVDAISNKASKVQLAKEIEQVQSLVKKSMNRLASVSGSLWNNLSKTFDAGLESLGSSLSKGSPKFLEQADNLVKSISGKLEVIKATALKFTSEASNALENFHIKNPSVMKYAKGAGRVSLQGLKTAGSSTLNLLGEAGSGIGSFIKNSAGKVASSVGNYAGEAADFLKNSRIGKFAGFTGKVIGKIAQPIAGALGALTVEDDQGMIKGTATGVDRLRAGATAMFPPSMSIDTGAIAVNNLTNSRVGTGIGSRVARDMYNTVFNGNARDKAIALAKKLIHGDKVTKEELEAGLKIDPDFLNMVGEQTKNLTDNEALNTLVGGKYNKDVVPGVISGINEAWAQKSLTDSGLQSSVGVGLQEHTDSVIDQLTQYKNTRETGNTPDSISVDPSKSASLAKVIENLNRNDPNINAGNLDEGIRARNKANNTGSNVIEEPFDGLIRNSPVSQVVAPSVSVPTPSILPNPNNSVVTIPVPMPSILPNSLNSNISSDLNTNNASINVNNQAIIKFDEGSARILAELLYDLMLNSDTKKYSKNPFARSGNSLISNASYESGGTGGGLGSIGSGSTGSGSTGSGYTGSGSTGSGYTGSGSIGSRGQGRSSGQSQSRNTPINKEFHLGTGELSEGSNGIGNIGPVSGQTGPNTGFGFGPLGTNSDPGNSLDPGKMSIGGGSVSSGGLGSIGGIGNFNGGFSTFNSGNSNNKPLGVSDVGQGGALVNKQGRVLSTADTSLQPHERALLDTIAGTESPGYNTMYGGNKFDSYSSHPNIAVPITSGPHTGETSSAAGRYQFIKGTWDEQAKKLGLTDFSPASQDKAALNLAKEEFNRKNPGRNFDADLKSNDPQVKGNAISSLRGRWTSLPGGIEQGKGNNVANAVKRFDDNVASNTKMAESSKDAPSVGSPNFDKYQKVNPDASNGTEKLGNSDSSNPWRGIDFGKAGPFSAQTSSNDALTDNQKSSLQRLQSATNQNIKVTSTTGGEHASGSQHYKGSATDISIRGKTPEEVGQLIEGARRAGFTGIGVGTTHLHLDTRPSKDGGTTVFNDANPGGAPVAGKTAKEWQEHLNKNVQPQIAELDKARNEKAQIADSNKVSPSDPPQIADSNKDKVASSDLSQQPIDKTIKQNKDTNTLTPTVVSPSNDSPYGPNGRSPPSNDYVNAASQSSDEEGNKRITKQSMDMSDNSKSSGIDSDGMESGRNKSSSGSGDDSSSDKVSPNDKPTSSDSGGSQYATMHNDSLGMFVLNDPHLTG